MTGSLQIKNEKYYIVLNIHDGKKRKTKWISTELDVKGNKRKAEKMLREILQEYEKTEASPKQNILFSDYIEKWLAYKKSYVDKVTFQSYEHVAKSHVIPYFAESKLFIHDVTTEKLQEYIDGKLSGELNKNKPLSSRTVRLHKNILNQALEYARKNKLIASNPCNDVEIPPIVKPEIKYYSAEQLKKLFEVLKGDTLEDIVKITAMYGLRKSEALGIKWDSIDFENDTLTIKHTVSKVTSTVEKDKTKTNSSRRTLPLLPMAKEIFLRLKEKENENSKLFGKEYQKNDYVFKWENGACFDTDYVTHHFSRVIEKNKLPSLTFHGLRHSCASVLLNSGHNPKDIQEWLGHADIRTTMNIYGHLDTSRKMNTASRIAECLS